MLQKPNLKNTREKRLENDGFWLHQHPKREPISESWDAFFMSFCVWVRLLPPPLAPKRAQMKKNTPTSLQNHAETC